MKNDLNLSQIGEIIAGFFRRYHVILYSLTVVIGVSIAIFMLTQLLSGGEQNSTDTNTMTFDKKTIEKIDSFNTRDKTPNSLQLPSGRINPFVE